MNFKQIVQDYFTFSRNERKGITVLLVIIFLLAVANKVIFYFETPAKIDANLLDLTRNEARSDKDSFDIQVAEKQLFMFNPNTIDRIALDSLALPEKVKQNILKFREKGGKFYSEVDFKRIYGVTDSIYNQLISFLVFKDEPANPTPKKFNFELFPFDPNTATDNDFSRLGLSGKQVKTIRKYQSKGGNFKSKDDFLKIYGIPQSQKNALVAYVTIAKTENANFEKKVEIDKIHIEINSADSIELMKLPGIGDKLSKRIVKYRDLLGGFNSFSQLKEVYGLSEQVIQQINGMVIVDPTKIHKVDLNFAEWNELAKHPYIQKTIARQIIKFRTKYGSIHEPSVLRDSLILNMEEYERLKPYF